MTQTPWSHNFVQLRLCIRHQHFEIVLQGCITIFSSFRKKFGEVCFRWIFNALAKFLQQQIMSRSSDKRSFRARRKMLLQNIINNKTYLIKQTFSFKIIIFISFNDVKSTSPLKSYLALVQFFSKSNGQNWLLYFKQKL